MKTTFAAILVLCATAAFAQADKKMENKGAEMKDMKAHDMKPAGTAAWKPAKVTSEDKKGLEEAYKVAEAAMMKGDLEAMAAMVDFPAFMMTDDSSGNGMGTSVSKEAWMKRMGDSMKNMPKDMKMSSKRDYTFLSDNMVVVICDNTSTVGKDKMKWKSSELLYKKGGKWMTKSMSEGGWGDMMKTPGTGGSPAMIK